MHPSMRDVIMMTGGLTGKGSAEICFYDSMVSGQLNFQL